MKFRVGDIVKIKEGLNYKNAPDFIDDMEKYCGKKAKVVDIIKPYYKLDIDKEEWYWDEETLEKFQEEYHIIVDGNTIIMRDNNGNESESDIDTSISIAIDRLKWKPKKCETYWTIGLSDDTNTRTYRWLNDEQDNELYRKGLVFKTRKEAKRVADKILKAIKE